MDRFVGDLQLTITDGGDEFYLIGDDRNQPTLPGELCYKDDAGAFCRCFNWRDGEAHYDLPIRHKMPSW